MIDFKDKKWDYYFTQNAKLSNDLQTIYSSLKKEYIHTMERNPEGNNPLPQHLTGVIDPLNFLGPYQEDPHNKPHTEEI